MQKAESRIQEEEIDEKLEETISIVNIFPPQPYSKPQLISSFHFCSVLYH